MANKVGELFVEILVDAASGNLSVRQLVGVLGDLNVASVATVGVIGTIGDTLWGMAKAATATSVELAKLHDVTGADPSITLKWERAAERLHISTASIVGGIRSVFDMQTQMERGGGQPGFMRAYGIEPMKANGAYKTFEDYIAEFARQGSHYQHLGRSLQYSLLKDLFPKASPDDIFRLVEQTRLGNFNPSSLGGLADKQIAALNKVDSDWITVKQDVVIIFEKFLLAGDGVDSILKSVHEMLEEVEKLQKPTNLKGAMEGLKDPEVWKNIIPAFFEMNQDPATMKMLRGAITPVGALPRSFAAAEKPARNDKLTITLVQPGKTIDTRTYDQKEPTNSEWTVAISQDRGLLK